MGAVLAAILALMSSFDGKRGGAIRPSTDTKFHFLQEIDCYAGAYSFLTIACGADEVREPWTGD